jgi:hypothetical protein
MSISPKVRARACKNKQKQKTNGSVASSRERVLNGELETEGELLITDNIGMLLTRHGWDEMSRAVS